MEEIKLYEGKKPELKLRKESYGFYVDRKEDGMGVAVSSKTGLVTLVQYLGICMDPDYINKFILEEEHLFILRTDNWKCLLGKIAVLDENDKEYMTPKDWVKEVNELYKKNN